MSLPSEYLNVLQDDAWAGSGRRGAEMQTYSVSPMFLRWIFYLLHCNRDGTSLFRHGKSRTCGFSLLWN